MERREFISKCSQLGIGLAAPLRPTLNIVDATRVLVTGGPQGPVR